MIHLSTLSSALLMAGISLPGLTPRLANHLEEVSSTEQISVIVVMEDQISGAELQGRMERLSRRDRASAVRAELIGFSRESQRGLDQLLGELRSSEQVSFTDRLWTVNSMRVTGTRSAIFEIAELPGVDRVRWDPDLLPEEIQDIPPPLAYAIGEAPFGSSFEAAAIPSELEALPPTGGRIETSTAFGPSTGLVHLAMDATAPNPGTLINTELHMDLSSVLGVTLTFDAQTFGAGGPNSGVFFSPDGVSYFKALSFFDSSPYQSYNLDVEAFVSSIGKRLNSNSRLAFRWNATDSLPTSGLTLDNLQVDAVFASGVPVEPNISGLQADQLWEIGIDGRGTLVLNVDSGVANDHPALRNQIWCNPGEIEGNAIDDDNNGFVDDIWGWDFASNDNDPYDGGHGTNVAGIVIGNGDGAGGVRTGMAPKAIMAVARVTNEGHALAAYQYAIEIGADVITASVSFKWPFKPDYHLHRQAAEVSLAAGIIHANSTGNNGQSTFSYPIPFNIPAPALCPGPWDHPDQAVQGALGSVLACTAIFQGSDQLDLQSGQGPSGWEDLNNYSSPWPYSQNSDYWDYPYDAGASPGLLKPDISAYTNVKTTTGNSGYMNSFGGTSAATPHVGGALCLLVDANERALPRQISHALQATAVDLGPAGKDLRFGAGKLQAFDAATRLVGLVTAVPQNNLLGETSNVEISGPQGSPYVLIIGLNGGTIPTSFGFNVEIGPPLYLFPRIHTGYSTPTVLPFVLGGDPSLSGTELFMQVATDDTAGTTGQWIISLLETVRWD